MQKPPAIMTGGFLFFREFTEVNHYMKYWYRFETPVGILSIAEDNGFITNVQYGLLDGLEIKETPCLITAAAQLNEYFDGKRRFFDLPLFPNRHVFSKFCLEGTA